MGIWFNPSDLGSGGAGNSFPNLNDVIMKGFKTAYTPKLMQAQIQDLQNKGLKNRMLAQIYNSVLGGAPLGSEQSGSIGLGGEENRSQSPDQNQPGNSGGIGISPLEIVRSLWHLPPTSPQVKQKMEIDTAKAKQANKANLDTGAANLAREYIQKNVNYPKKYMGFGGSLAMAKDLEEYNRTQDPEAKQRLLDATVSEMLVPEYAGFQLQSQGQRSTVPALKHQREDTIRKGRAYFSKKITDNLPADLQNEAVQLHAKHIQEINRTREGFYNSGGKRESVESKNINHSSKSNNKKYKWSDIQETARKHNHSPNEVIDNLAKHKGMDPMQFMNQYVDSGE